MCGFSDCYMQIQIVFCGQTVVQTVHAPQGRIRDFSGCKGGVQTHGGVELITVIFSEKITQEKIFAAECRKPHPLRCSEILPFIYSKSSLSSEDGPLLAITPYPGGCFSNLVLLL